MLVDAAIRERARYRIRLRRWTNRHAQTNIPTGPPRGGRSSEMDRQSTEVLIGIVILILVIVLYLQRPPVVPKTIASSKPLPTIVKPELERQITASPNPLPTIVKPGENWLSPSDISVVDGDTIRARGRTVRLVGFDAPETGDRARCHGERELAQRATEQLRRLVAGGGIDLRMVPCACAPGTEGTSACNFGRACGYLSVQGRDVGATLISKGLAKPYLCGATSCPPRQLWC